MTPRIDPTLSMFERVNRRRLLKGTLGAAAATAALPAFSGIVAAHFPTVLDIDITPETEENEIDPASEASVSVAVLTTTYRTEAGERATFDPTEQPVRYRFGAPTVVENGGGARPVGNGEVRDVDGDGHDDLVLQFPVAETGFSGDESMGHLLWERDESGEHGLAAEAPVTLVEETEGHEHEHGHEGELSDVDILNYALTLEHLEAAYYNDFLAEYSESEVERSEVANYFARPTLQYSTYQRIQDVRDHEEAHVEALTQTIEKLGGTPVEPAEYEFAYSSIEEFVAVADRLEAVGVSAYAGVAPMIDNTEVLKAALSIHSVEANHQTYFQLLHLQRPAPDAFNVARSMEQVLPIAKQFISSE